MTELIPAPTFSAGDAAIAPTGPEAPSEREVQAIGVLGLDMRKAGRVTLMNQICTHLHVPMGGWHGQAKLFEDGDVRLRALLAKMADERRAKLMAANLDRAAKYTDVNLMLALVSAAREYDRSLTAKGTALIETYAQGGLDFLWDEKKKLGLPHAVTKPWQEVPRFLNRESGNMVHPALIPARDQLMAYAAQIGASFRYNFKNSIRAEFGVHAEVALAGASRSAILAWQAYTFLSPGGRDYDPKKPLRDQLGQKFGHRSALGLYAHIASQAGRAPSLEDILTDTTLERLEWFRSAKTRAAETLFMERLLKRARELLPH